MESAISLFALVVIAYFGAFGLAAAQTNSSRVTEAPPDAPIYQLEEFVVTGTPLRLPVFKAASDLDSIQGDELLGRQTANLGATLDFLPGVSTVNTGSGVGKPVIRGLSGNRIRVLNDGIGVSYQQFGVRHPPNIDPFLAGRLEVVRGVSSILYGSDAFGGAINVLSPEIPYAGEGESPNFNGRATYGYESGHDLHTGALNVAYGEEQFGFVAGIVRREAGNLTVPDVETWNGPPPTGQPSDIPRFADELDFTDYEQWNTMIKGGYLIGPTEFTLRFERWDHENNYLLPPGTGIGLELENNQLQAIGKGSLSSDWEWRTSYTWNQNLRKANPGGQPLPVENANIDIERNSHTARAEFTYGDWLDRFSGKVGVEGLYEDQESTGPTGLTPGGQIENLALFGTGRTTVGPWSFEAGLRYDHRSQEGDPSQTSDPSLLANRTDPVSGAPVNVELENDYDIVTASLGAVYEFSDSFALAANLSRGFRAPSLFELYANGVHGGVAALQFGEADLDAETSLGGDLQARWRSEKFDLTATTYVTSISDYIFLADTGSTTGGLPIFKVGQDDATLVGGDLSATFRATDWLTVNAVYEMVRGEFDDGGADLPLLPADQFQLEFVLHRESLGMLEHPEFRIGLRHAFSKDSAGTQEPFSQFDANPNFGTASTDAYTLLDLGFGFEVDRLRFDLTVKNVTDEDYRDFLDTYKGYALSPGRSINLQASFEF